MRRTDSPARSLRRRLGAVILCVLLTLAALSGCAGREGQTTQPGVNEEAVPGQGTATATADTEYTNDDEGTEDGEGTEPGAPSPPQTIIAPEPEPAEDQESPEH
jgi:hypothetical protein